MRLKVLLPVVILFFVATGLGWQIYERLDTGTAKKKGRDRGDRVLPVEVADIQHQSIALRKQLAGKIPGMTIHTCAPQGQFLLERLLSSEEGVTVEVRGFELETLDLLARRVVEGIQDVPGITDVEPSREAGIPQEEIEVDRAKVADLGLSVRDVTEAIQTAVAGAKASEYRVGGNSYRILVQLEDAEKRSLDEILDITLRTPGEGLVGPPQPGDHQDGARPRHQPAQRPATHRHHNG
jgi:multidrug efflux pump subunit AcrB